MSQISNDPAPRRAGTAEITETDRHRLLANDRRRVVLAVVEGHSTPVELGDLATDVARFETNGEVSWDDVIERVAISLHHHHLPIMTDVGILEYDPTTRQIVSVRATAEHLYR